jgi:hypothetical protein
MKITKKQKEKLLLLGYMVMIVLVAYLARDFFISSAPQKPTPYEQREKIEIDFSPLEKMNIGEMEVWEPIPPLSGEFGRENPFIPLGGQITPAPETE